MDNRRLNTGDILSAPETDVPQDREGVDAEDTDTWAFIGADAVVAALEAGKLVSSSNHYGIPYVWKAGEGVYRGTLLQYRSVTEDPTFASAEEAAEWFEEAYHATYG